MVYGPPRLSAACQLIGGPNRVLNDAKGVLPWSGGRAYTLYWCDFDTSQDGGSCQMRATGMEVRL